MIFAVLVCSRGISSFCGQLGVLRDVNFLLAVSPADLRPFPRVPRIWATPNFLGGLFAAISFLNLPLIFFIFPYEHIIVIYISINLKITTYKW